jgi:hypothetical protein
MCVLHNHAKVSLEVKDKDGEVEALFESFWDGETQCFDVTLYPEDWAKATDGEPAQFNVTFATSHNFNRRRFPKKADATNQFSVMIPVLIYPPPSAPLDLMVTSRTQSSVSCKWSPPTDWGGCAVAKYEVEMRTKSKEGTYGEWTKVATPAQRPEPSGQPQCATHALTLTLTHSCVRLFAGDHG